MTVTSSGSQAPATAPVDGVTVSVDGVDVTVPKGTGAQMKTLIQRSDPLVAPLAAGQKVGTIQVTTATGTPVASLPLVVQEPVELAGLLGRAWDSLRLWIK